MDYCPITKQECRNPKCVGCICVKASGEYKDAKEQLKAAWDILHERIRFACTTAMNADNYDNYDKGGRVVSLETVRKQLYFALVDIELAIHQLEEDLSDQD